jgi:hypothetical protein
MRSRLTLMLAPLVALAPSLLTPTMQVVLATCCLPPIASAHDAPAEAAWVVVPSPNPNGNGILLSVAAVPRTTTAWAVGFYDQDLHDQSLIAHWDGSSWQVVPSPSHGGSDNILRGVTALGPDDAWAVGSYDPGGGPRTFIVHWDGALWSIVPSVNPSLYDQLNSVAAESRDSVWAVGHHSVPGIGHQALIEHWDGDSWSVVPGPRLGDDHHELNSVTVVRDALAPQHRPVVWAAGTTWGDNGLPSTLITRWDWDTMEWSVIPSPDASSGENHLTGIEGSLTEDVWSVGRFSTPTDQFFPLTEHWNGSTWEVVGAPSASSSLTSLTAVAAVSPNDAWAVGYFDNDVSARLTLAQHWDGASWSSVATPNPAGTGQGEFNSLESIAHVPGSGLWAVGYWQHPSSPPQTLIAFYSAP